jgi:hypothetical protein
VPEIIVYSICFTLSYEMKSGNCPAEALKPALGLRVPELAGRDIYFAEAICFFTNIRQLVSPVAGGQ